MHQLQAYDIAIIVVLALVVIALAWLSLIMASVESAVGQVTRASLNNLILEEQTSDETQFTRMKHIDRIHHVQRLIDDRYATGGACTFFRVLCNIITGTLVAVLAGLCGAPLWAEVLSGVLFALVFGVVTVKVRPRSMGAAQPLQCLLHYHRIARAAVALAPFARDRHAKRHVQELSDDEELEKLQLEQSKATIDRLAESSDMDPEISEMLRNVLTLSDTLTREIMVPRTDMICIDRDQTLQSALKMFSRSGFSRVPIIGESVDDLVGMAYMKDAVRAVTFNPQAASRTVDTIAREPMLVPETKPVDDLFHQMQRSRQHIAVVVDEYGGIAGLVTIEDTIEQIVGELEDEHDRTQHADPVKVGDRTWKVPARTPLSDIEELFEIDLDEDDVDTVYGLLTKALGRVPLVGSSAVTRGLRLTAVDSAGRRKKVSTILVEPAGDEFDTKADSGSKADEAESGVDSQALNTINTTTNTNARYEDRIYGDHMHDEEKHDDREHDERKHTERKDEDKRD